MLLTAPLALGPDPAGLPLAGHALFAGADPDKPRAKVAGVCCDHRLELIGRAPFDARHNRFAGKSLSLNVMQSGAKTLIVPGALPDFYLFQMPLAGFASVTPGAERHENGPGRSDVVNPGRARRG